MEISFASYSANSTFHVLSDNFTALALMNTVQLNCSYNQNLTFINSTSPLPYNDTDPNSPKPEQAIQYYRASSVVLTLDGYNDTAALSNDTTLPDTPLPANVDVMLLGCLNQTIGLSVPLVDPSTSGASHAVSSLGLFGFAWFLWFSLLS
jgi:hypothetical protein